MKCERPPFPVGKGAVLDGALFAGGFYRGVLGDGEGNGILQHGIGGQQLGHDDIAGFLFCGGPAARAFL